MGHLEKAQNDKMYHIGVLLGNFQNVRGVKFGEYRCEKEEDLAMISAQQYYIEFGTDLNTERLFNHLPNYIPDYCLQGDNSLERWHQLVIQAFKKVLVLILQWTKIVTWSSTNFFRTMKM